MNLFLNQDLTRLRVLLALMLAGLGVLAVALWRMQVGQRGSYQTSLERQSVRRVRIPGTRGCIFDRQGVCLADNVPAYGAALYLEELRPAGKRRALADAWAAVQRVSGVLGLEPQVTRAEVERHWYNRKPLPLIAWRHLDDQAMARLAEAGPALPGVDLVAESDRIYPSGAVAAHVLGAVKWGESDADPDEEDDTFYHYARQDLSGRWGLESRFDELLRGQSGGNLVRVDVSGFKHDETPLHAPVPGGDVQLAIDVRIQRAAEEALADTVGAAVVLDPNTGDVLALASAPGFDPNDCSPTIATDVWKQLNADERKPLFNRALGGRYAPGSIFKPLVALAALESGRFDAGVEFDCPGYFTLGNRRFACFMNTAHGRLGLRHALMVSCNVFFYQLGLQCGPDPIHDLAATVGLGRRTGIELGPESPGLLPGREWKAREYGEGWRDGDTCNLAIGQGDLLVTPLQMAVVAAAIANGGRVYRPRLVLGVRPRAAHAYRSEPVTLVRQLGWSAASLALVRGGMRDVVQEQGGSGHLARLPDVEMAGKTGTAEFGRKGSGQKHGWMILYAPVDAPRYAVAMVMDEAISGGASVGPRMHRLMRALLALEREASS